MSPGPDRCWPPGVGGEARRTVTVYGFSILGEVMNEGVFPAFQDEWQATRGEQVEPFAAPLRRMPQQAGLQTRPAAPEPDMMLLDEAAQNLAHLTVDALNAGKDVYVEKPLTLRNEEGPEIIKAARLNKRVCQVGMQQRSGKHYIEAKEQYFDTGRLGRVTLVRTWWHGNTFHLRRAPAELQTQPADLDWARFVGPLPWRDYDPQQFYNWRAYLDYGGGQITDLFTHWIDVVHMFMGQDIPVSAVASGGVYAYQDGRTAPDTIHVLLEYPGPFTATFEATLVPGITGAGIEFCGTEGRLTITRGAYEFFPVPVRSPCKPAGEPQSTLVRATSSLDQDHMGNFIDCVKSRKLPNGDVLIGHRSAQASHLGNIAYMEKRRINFDPVREVIVP